MNQSISSIGPLNQNSLMQSLPLSESVSRFVSKGVKLHEPLFDSELTEVVSKLEHVAQISFREIPASCNHGEIKRSLQLLPNEEENEEDLFEEEIIVHHETMNQKASAFEQNILQQQEGIAQELEGVLENTKNLSEKRETIAEQKEVVESKLNAVKNTQERETNIDSLKNQKIPVNLVKIVHEKVAGDLAAQFLSKKSDDLHVVVEFSKEFGRQCEKLLEKYGLEAINIENLDQAALTAYALKANARGDVDFNQEDAEKATAKAVQFLRPDMRDKKGWNS